MFYGYLFLQTLSVPSFTRFESYVFQDNTLHGYHLCATKTYNKYVYPNSLLHLETITVATFSLLQPPYRVKAGLLMINVRADLSPTNILRPFPKRTTYHFVITFCFYTAFNTLYSANTPAVLFAATIDARPSEANCQPNSINSAPVTYWLSCSGQSSPKWNNESIFINGEKHTRCETASEWMAANQFASRRAFVKFHTEAFFFLLHCRRNRRLWIYGVLYWCASPFRWRQRDAPTDSDAWTTGTDTANSSSTVMADATRRRRITSVCRCADRAGRPGRRASEASPEATACPDRQAYQVSSCQCAV